MSRVAKYLKNCNMVYHTTFDPMKPGAVRIHMIPPKKLKPGYPWVVILNGYSVLPLQTSWAVLLIEFIKEYNKTDGKNISDDEILKINKTVISNVQDIFPLATEEILNKDLKTIIRTLKDVAVGVEPNTSIGYLTLAKYAKFMKAPHRMDLMISAMEKDGKWNCNAKCLHCYATGEKLASVKELDTASWKTIIDKCKDACISQLTFTGGEPTRRKDLVELVEYSSWFVTRVNTNGILMTKELAEKLYKASLDSLQITFYSNDSAIHNILVGGNHYDETLQGIKNALAAGLNVSINTPLCSLNKNYLDTIKFLHSLGVTYFSCSGLIITGQATQEKSSQTRLDKTELLDILKEVYNYTKENGLEIAFTSPGFIDAEDLKEMNMVVPSCGACLSNMAVAPDGEVIPCQSWLYEEGLGNLLTSNFNTIWQNDKCRIIRNKSVKDTEICPLSIRNGVNC